MSNQYEEPQEQQGWPAQPAQRTQAPPTHLPVSHTGQLDQEPPSLQPSPHHTVRAIGLTAAEKFWYVLGCIAFGAMYFAKIPSKKALADFGLAELTAAETFWYVLMCIAFGGGYFAKIPTAKALSELEQFRRAEFAQLEPHTR